MIVSAMLVSLYIVFTGVLVALLWWARRAELAEAGPMRLPVALSTGGEAENHQKPTVEQLRVLQALGAPKVRIEVRSWLLRLGVAEHEVDDVAAEVMLQATRSIGSYERTKARPRTWLRGIVANVASRHRDLARHRLLELRDELDALDEAPGAHEMLEAEDERLAVEAALVNLPERERAVGRAILEKRTMAEVGDELQLPVVTRYRARARALEAFAAALRKARA